MKYELQIWHIRKSVITVRKAVWVNSNLERRWSRITIRYSRVVVELYLYANIRGSRSSVSVCQVRKFVHIVCVCIVTYRQLRVSKAFFLLKYIVVVKKVNKSKNRGLGNLMSSSYRSQRSLNGAVIESMLMRVKISEIKWFSYNFPRRLWTCSWNIAVVIIIIIDNVMSWMRMVQISHW